MPADVIQDSDESDAELSDIVTSIDPLQVDGHCATITVRDTVSTKHHPQQQEQDGRHKDARGPKEDVGSSNIAGNQDTRVSADLDPTFNVNFDHFIASQSQSQDQRGLDPRTGTGTVSSSQERREKAWLGGNEGDAGPINARSILKRGKTIDATHYDDNGEENCGMKGVKRRRTMDVFGIEQGGEAGARGERVGFAGSLSEHNEGGNGGGGRGSVEAGVVDMRAQPVPASGGHGTPTNGELAVTEPPNTAAYLLTQSIPEPQHLTRGVHYRKRPPSRSKSSQGFDDTAHDTEPMSSTSLARAHRTMSTSMVSNPPQSSTESMRDELALPPTIEIAITNIKPTSMRRNEHFTTGAAGAESDQDELDCISNDYGEIPKECYSARLGSARSKDIADANTNREEETNRHVEVVIPHEDFPSLQKRCKGNSAVTETVDNQGDEDTLTTTHAHPTQPETTNGFEPLEISKPPCKGAKKKMKRGKTTSVILKKAVESDVEDDVIWIDEQPSDVTFKETKNCSTNSRKQAERHEQCPQLPSKSVEEDIRGKPQPDFKTEDERVIEPVKERDRDVNDSETQQLPSEPPAPEPAPAPKKRGRKRTKTSDNLAVEAEPPIKEKKDTQPPEKQNQNIPSSSKDNPERRETSQQNSGATHAVPATAGKPQTVTPPNDTEQKTRSPSPAPQSPATQVQAPAPSYPVETPKKPIATPIQKGPDKHSPIEVNKKVPYRVGLSRTAKIAPLLKVVRK
ncbi:hypothetical protein AJ79_09551 [Helicocarpus griseus UAMH5409]|uniref:Uncharacterized protein n=1 Tax=Helicocarpus griseus UAMH5409 TaxID=1447875 RepID=A0A2B7WAG3_9EURO|nr:hypothetical protein AJ79_09551 [Helicocarpus griseus UAMH5409]